MNKVLVNQEFHEDLTELVTEIVTKVNEEKDVPDLEHMIQEKIDNVYDHDEWMNEVESMIDDAKSEVENDFEDKITENIDDKLDDIREEFEGNIRRDLPRLLDTALEDRKIDKEELKEAVLELKAEWNKLIAEQVKYHFNILAGFMMEQFKKE